MGILLAVLVLAFALFCLLRESKTVGFYKYTGTFGRITAYLSLFLPLGIIAFAGSLLGANSFGKISGIKDFAPVLIMMAIGVAVVMNVIQKCPEGISKGKCIFDLFTVGLGATMKIIVFFVKAAWKLQVQEVTVDGQNAIIYGGYAYDTSGRRIGQVDPGNPDQVIMDN